MSPDVCFVIMGYGVKTDHTTGRILDLDKTYKNIIKPAVEQAGLSCVRADEVRHAGVIDVPMYRYILTADVVIADLSTSNPNTLYELGVRHALRPRTTIAISEKDLKYPFDLEHTVIRRYEHLGKDIGYDEALRFRGELVSVISEVLMTQQVDSPIYTYLSELRPPSWEDSSMDDRKQGEEGERLSDILSAGIIALDEDDFMKAKTLFGLASQIDKGNVYVIQKLALATYKSKAPSQIESLNEALEILNPLKLDRTTDPETLGLCGAIYKRLWEETDDIENLVNAIAFYERGFYIGHDYYNGINMAYLLDVRANISLQYDAIADYVMASRIRQQVASLCNELLKSDFNSRSDQYWILATLEEAYFGLGEMKEYEATKMRAMASTKENWERKTTECQIQKLSHLLEGSPIKKI